ncbi:MAG TPA: ABC transporter substrate-binding protein, partial [Actinomycetota bacterium]|nr:ABC transporter substrate-binding protein [Actinomycetota bacterium]
MSRATLAPAGLLLALVMLSASCRAAVLTGAAPGGTFRVGTSEPASLDPALASRPEERLVVKQLFEGLVRYDDTTAAVVPGIAMSWDTSPDNTRFTFHLRPRARFSNGEPLTAESFVRGMTRALTPAQYRDPQGLGYELDGITGAAAVVSGAAATLSGAKALDSHTLELRLSAPDAEFLVRCGDSPFFPVPSAATMAARRPSWGESPVGNGAFKLGEPWAHNESISLVPNKLHLGSRPRVGRVELRMFTDLDAAYRAWRAGELDWTAFPPVKTSEVKRLDASSYINRPSAGLDYLVVRAPPAPADGALFRRALSLAIDRRRITSTLFAGATVPAAGIVPPRVPGSASSGGVSPCRSCGFDPAQARELLAASGVKLAGTFPLYFSPGVGEDAWMVAVAQDLKANLGIDARAVPGAAAVVPTEPAMGAAGGVRVMRYPTPDDFLQKVLGTGGRENASGYTNPHLDSLVASALRVADPAVRAREFQQAERLALDDMPIIPLWWQRGVGLARLHRWGGLGMDAFGDPTLRTVAV